MEAAPPARVLTWGDHGTSPRSGTRGEHTDPKVDGKAAQGARDQRICRELGWPWGSEASRSLTSPENDAASNHGRRTSDWVCHAPARPVPGTTGRCPREGRGRT